MAELHLLRPWWLLALPVGAWLIWLWLGGGRRALGGWSRIVDTALQPHVLERPDAMRTRRWPLAAALLALAAAVIALAGPSFERVEVPAFRADDALVVALDLSRSMNARDVEPDRLTRARLKLLSLLDRREGGQTALVVFASHAFTVTPLTSDTRAIASLVGALSTDIMPRQGSATEAGLERAGRLLAQTGITSGDVLLITDSAPGPDGIDAARTLVGDGYRVHVLAVGTAEGAPIPNADGGFVLDASGAVVVPRVEHRALARLADVGGGRFARLTPDDRDLEHLLPGRASSSATAATAATDDGSDDPLGADTWRDDGVWFAVLLLPLLLPAFRRGWVAGIACVLLWPMPRAEAFDWMDLWQRPDQRAVRALERDAPEAAAELFEDPAWRAVAQYRAGEFDSSAASLGGLESVLAHYNRGTALARAGQIERAIAAYDRVLEIEPDHEDARYNRDLLQELLDDQQQNQEQQPQQSDAGESEAADGDAGAENEAPQQADADSGDGEQQDGEQQDGATGDASERTADAASDDSSDAAEGEPQPADADESRAAEPEPREDRQRLASAEELEEWASDQAAEQWLRRVPQDPGGLLRRKFLYQYQRLGVDQDGNRVRGDDEDRPW